MTLGGYWPPSTKVELSILGVAQIVLHDIFFTSIFLAYVEPKLFLLSCGKILQCSPYPCDALASWDIAILLQLSSRLLLSSCQCWLLQSASWLPPRCQDAHWMQFFCPSILSIASETWPFGCILLPRVSGCVFFKHPINGWNIAAVIRRLKPQTPLTSGKIVFLCSGGL